MSKTNLDSTVKEKSPGIEFGSTNLTRLTMARSKTLNTMSSKNIIFEKRGKGLGINRLSTESSGSHRARNSQVKFS